MSGRSRFPPGAASPGRSAPGAPEGSTSNADARRSLATTSEPPLNHPLPHSRVFRTALLVLFALGAFAPDGSAEPANASCDAAPLAAGLGSTGSPHAALRFEDGERLAAAGDHAGAVAAFDESARIASETNDPTGFAFARAGAARSAARIDSLRPTREAPRLESAETMLDAPVLDESAADMPDAASAIARLGAARASASRVTDPRLRAQLEIHIGRSFLLLGDERRAAEAFIAAAAQASAAEAWRLHSFALGYLAALYEQRGQYDDAVSLTQRALFSAERAAAPESIYRWHWQLARLRLVLAQPESALASYRASVATIRGAKELEHAATDPVYAGLVGLLVDAAERADAEARQQLLAETRDVLEDQNVSELRDYFRDPCLDAKRKAAPDEIPGTLVVYPVLLEDAVVMISSHAGKLDSFRLPVGREDFVEEVRAFRRSLEDRTSRRYLRHGDRLYRWMIAPLESLLESDAVETLVFVPRGALYTIPIAALYDGSDRQFLIEKTPLAITPSLTLTEPRSIDRESTQLLAAGISESVQGYTPLVSVIAELEAIAEDFPGRKLMNEGFIATSFERELDERPFGIVHVASHGEFSSDAAESFVLTYDGRISMDRLAALVGKTQFRAQSLELLTLSACESAAGDDRAALGLAGVALQAGARSALATLWSVSDQASAELMIEFYDQLTKPGQTRAEALQHAQVHIMKQRAYRHPTYWAPFLLVSSWL